MVDHLEFRRRPSGISPYADVELELTELTFLNYTAILVVGGIGQTAAPALLAAHYRDPWLWKVAACMFLICSLRSATSAVFAGRRTIDLTLPMAQRRQAIWAVENLVLSAIMSIANLYVFSRYDMTGTSICIIGTFAICSSMSARITVQPGLIQLCGCLMLGSLAWAMFHNCEPLLGRIGALLCLFYAAVHCSAVQTKFNVMVAHIRTRRKLRDLAERDTLTGLANRRHFQTRLAALCANGSSFAVLYMDLDRFKHVNDTFGHAVGDALLRGVSERLSSLVRSSDLLARLGGDEFAILQHPMVDEEAAQALAYRINQEIGTPFEIEGQLVQVGSSIGIRVAGKGERDPSRLLNLADEALYRVKQAGGGGFRTGEFQN